MTIRLYLETNFLLSHAHGRDPATSRLILESWPDLQIVLPTCCVLEALTNLEAERKRINQRVGQNQGWIGELNRSPDSPSAGRLATLLHSAEDEWRQTIAFFEQRLNQAIQWSADPSRVISLATDLTKVPSSALLSITADPTDQLILHTILEDARNHPDLSKVLLTENRLCFHDHQETRQALTSASIRYFRSATKFLQWHDAQTET